MTATCPRFINSSIGIIHHSDTIREPRRSTVMVPTFHRTSTCKDWYGRSQTGLESHWGQAGVLPFHSNTPWGFRLLQIDPFRGAQLWPLNGQIVPAEQNGNNAGCGSSKGTFNLSFVAVHVVMCKTWSFRAVHVLLDPACSWGTSHFYHSANTGVVAQDGPKDRTDQSLTSGCAEMDKMDEENKEGSSQYSSISIRIWETGHGVSEKMCRQRCWFTSMRGQWIWPRYIL